MARALRIQFPGAIYHAMARGNARQKIFFDERDYGRFLEGLEATFEKFRFEIFSFVELTQQVLPLNTARSRAVMWQHGWLVA